MNLLGQAVKHEKFGNGVITELCGNKITVCFAESSKLFLFPEAIPRYLTLKNNSIQKKIEIINEERTQLINEEKKKIEEENKYRNRLYTMKIPLKSQVAYNILEDAIGDLNHVKAGCFLSGPMKGKPRIPANIQPNSAIILTDCAFNNEDERTIVGVAMADERFWGSECTDGIIKLHRKYKLTLPDEHKISFWKYFKREVFSSRWGNVPFKYFQNQIMERILFDIYKNMAGTEQEVKANCIYHYFCKLNRIPAKQNTHNEAGE